MFNSSITTLYLSIHLLLNIGISSISNAQDTNYIRSTIYKLSSNEMYGRGYVNKGDKKAADFIENELKSIDVEPIGKSYFQSFSFPMNTFPGKMILTIDGKTLNPVHDFVVHPNSPSVKGEFPIVYLPDAIKNDSVLFDSLIQLDYSGKYVVMPQTKRKIKNAQNLKVEGIIIPKSNLIWWASSAKSVAKIPVINVVDSLIQNKKVITIHVEQKFHKKYKSQNVIALIEGTEFPDSIIVFSAHYDHLGTMGEGNIFRGANDNASGTAMLLSIAKQISSSEKQAKYSIAFMFFSGEERGILGSKYYVENPIFPLTKIKMLINLDMVGTGSNGLAIVNGEKQKDFTLKIQTINTNNNYFNTIKIRGESCNSDHCFFDKAGVPAVFLYTMGEEFKEYHNLKDIPENLPLTKAYELQNLLIKYINTY